MTVPSYSSSSTASSAIAPRSIVFIDTQIANYEQLAAGVAPDAQVVLLSANEDGITQISHFLATQTGISAVHIVSHGSSGNLLLGNSDLNSQTLSLYESSIRAWANALTEDADILLYGCDVAAGDLGQAFVDIFSQWTGADVAASNDLTGNAALDGDWNLEVNVGEIATDLVFQADVLATYNSVFATISGAQQTAITSGLDSFATWAGTLDSYDKFGQQLLLIHQSPPTAIDTLGEAIDLDAVIRNQLRQTVVDYFATNPDDPNTAPVETFTTQALAAFINSRFPGWSVSADDSDPTTLQLNVSILATTSQTSAIDLGKQAEDLRLGLAASGTFSTTLDLDFALRVGAGNAFSVQITNLEASGQVSAPLGSSTQGNLGILGFTAGAGSSLNLVAGVDATVNSGAVLTLAQLQDTSNISSLVTLTQTAANGVNGSIIINPLPLNGLTISGTPGVNVSATATEVFITDLASNLAPTITPNADFAQLANFSNLAPEELQGMLQQLGTWFAQLGDSSLLNQTIPLTGSTTLGDQVDFGEAYFAQIQRFLVTFDGLSVSPTLATNGRLGGTASFALLINGTVYEIAVAPDLPNPNIPGSGNNSLNDLLDDINQAINRAVNGDPAIVAPVQASYNATLNKIVFQAASPATTVTLHEAANLRSTLLGTRLTLGTQSLMFHSAQELEALLNARLAAVNANVQANYNAATNDLTFDISPTAANPNWAIALNRNVTPINFADLSGLTDVRNNNSRLNASVRSNLDFTFGVNLLPNEDLLVSPPIHTPEPLTNFQLPAPANFSVQIFTDLPAPTADILLGNGTPLNVSVTTGVNPNRTAQDLVQDVQAALNAAIAARPDLIAAGLTVGDIVAQWTGDRIAVWVKPWDKNDGTAPVDRRLEVSTSFNDPAYTGLGILTAPTPYNGQLTSAATLQFFVNGSPAPVTVTVNPDASNNSIDDLIADINSALDAQGLTTIRADRAVTNSTGNRIVFKVVSDPTITRLEVLVTDPNPANPTNGAITQLGFQNGQRLQAKGRATNFFLQDANFTGNTTLTPTQINPSQPFAKANYGYLGLDITGSSGDITGVVNLTLKDPTTNNSRVTLKSLLTALVKNAGVDNAASIITPGSSVTGAANLTFTVTPEAGITLSPASTTIGLNLPNWIGVARPYSVSGLTAYDPFKNISFTRFIDGLEQVVTNYVNQLETVAGALDQALPVLNQSAYELLDLSDRLTNFINQIETTPVKTIQGLNTLLQQSLGLPVGGANLFTLDLTGSPALRLDLPFQQSFNDSYGMDLDLPTLAGLAGISVPPGLSNLVGVSSTGNLNVGIDGTFNLAMGFDLSNPVTSPFLYVGSGGTGLTVNASASATDLDFTAQIGPISLVIQDGNANLAGNFNLTTSGSGRQSFAAALAGITVSAGGNASVVLPLDDTGTNQFAVAIPDLAAFLNSTPGSVTLTLPDLASLIASSPLGLLSDPEVMIDGLDQLLLMLQDALNSQVYGVNLPLIGDALADAGQFIEGFRDDILSYLSNQLRRYTGAPEGIVDVVRQTLFNIFASPAQGAAPLTFGSSTFGGLGILRDRDGNSIVNLNDIGITPPSGWSDGIQFDLRLGQNLTYGGAIDFETGLEGLGLTLDAGARLNLDWNLDLGFGVDRNQGFYLDTSDANELTLDVTADLIGAGGAENASVGGVLGFLGLTAAEVAGDPTRLALDFAIDLKGGSSGSDRLTFSEMVASSTTLDEVMVATANGTARMNLQLTLGADFDGNPANKTDVEKALPAIFTNLIVDWPFLNASTTNGIDFGGLPTFNFTGINLDLGTFISDFASPFLSKIQDVLEPFDWLLDPNDGLLYMRLPIISDLAGETINLKKLIELFDSDANITPFLDAIEEVYFLVNLVSSASADADGRNLVLNLGNLGIGDLGGIDLRRDSLQTATAPTRSAPNLPGDGAAGDFLSRLTGGSGDSNIAFPILEPVNIFKLLLGQDVPLVTYDLPSFGFNFEYTQSFPVFGPLFANLRGFFGANMDLAFGYDTKGFSQFRDTSNFLDLVNGFFVSDVDLNSNVDIPELVLNGGIGAGASLNVGVAEAGVEGGIEFIADFNLNDPDRDGRVRFAEMAENIELNSNNPLAIFDISARLEWYFRAFIEILFVIDESMDLGRGVLYDFGDVNFNRPPILAQQRGDTLYLNVGRNAHNRINGNVVDGNETITLTQSGGQFLVSGFGITNQSYSTSGVTRIVAYGDQGNDNITINLDSGSTVQVEIYGGVGDDTLTGGGANDQIYGGEGRDSLSGNGGNDRLFGQQGDDVLSGGDGNDFLDAADGNDQVTGGNDNDTVIGGVGNDALDGGLGNDLYLFGSNWGVDTVTDAGGTADTWDFANQDNRIITTTDILFTLNNNQIEATSLTNRVTIAGFGIEALKGGRGGDIYEIFQTGSDFILLDGQGGSDEYRAHFRDPGSPPQDLKVRLRDTGNSWDTDVAIAYGSNGNDTLTVTDTLVRADFSSGSPQEFQYNAFPDSGIEALEVYARPGEDQVTIESTPVNTSVMVSGEEDSDTFIVGGPTVDNIRGDAEIGRPLVIKGNGGKDRLIVNDAGDASNNTGTLTNERIRGLDMTVGIDYETIERVDIALGSGNDNFTVLSTISGTTTIAAGTGNDTVTIQAIGGALTVNGNADNDLLDASTSTSSLPINFGGGSGNDTILGGAGNDQIRGDSDFTVAFTKDASIVNETVTYTTQSSQGRDSIQGRGGQDVIFGEGNDDDIIGGSAIAGQADGADFIFGGAGNDAIAGDNATIDPISRLITNLDTPGNPADSLFGDNGTLTFDNAGTPITINSNDTTGTLTVVAGTVVQATSNSAVGDGNDTIAGNVGDDNILGGGGNDSLAGNAGNDRILGDNGTVNYNASGLVTQITTSEPDVGGNDTVTGDDGDDLILGGAGNDSVMGGVGHDRILGDNGSINYVVDGDPTTLDLVTTSNPNIGGNDTIAGNEGDDIALGGAGNDTMTGGSGADQLLGDNGQLTFITGNLARVETSDPTTGGNDSIAGEAGNDIILGGFGNDTILGNADDDILLGDNGLVDYGVDSNLTTLDVIKTTNPGDGGDDRIEGGTGNDVALGGAAADTIDGQSGDDQLLGDNGELVYTNGILSRITTTDVAIGGNDTITGGEGDDTAIGGAANDSITGNTGADVALGDNGQILFMGGVIRRIETLAPEVGGNDTIAGNEGNDRILGGSGNDSINGNADDDILLGDNGFLDYGEDSNLATLDRITTTDPTFGGNDTIAGDAGNDTILGGAANDSIAGGTGNDVALGDNGRVRLTGGVVRLIETTDANLGGNDSITGDAGDDILLGGAAHDRISGNAGNDILLGDNGQLNYEVDANLATLDLITSTDPAIGGNDTISGDDGSDIAFGGAANDTITGGAGEDKLLGDNGQVIFLNGLPDLIQTIAPGIGGNDDISGNAEDDLIAGGFAGDILNGDNGDDRILGDHGNFDYTYAGDSQVAADTNPFTLDFFTTTDPTLGGNDLIVAGLGNDTALGGTGSDQIYGDQGVDTTDATWQIVATGDFNHDGFSDLIWRNSVTGRNFIWLMAGDQLLAARPLQDITDLNWQIVGTGDFNGDGETDILWRQTQLGVNGVWFMNGVLYQSAGSLMPQADLGWNIVGTGDFNGDKKVDILWRHQQSGANGVWAMDGINFVQALGIAPVSDLTWKVAGVRDFNADGNVDILWRHQQSGTNGIWLMEKNNFLAAQGVLGVGDLSWSIGGVGDVNGDSKTDIVWRNNLTGTIGLWHMDGNTLLGTAALPPAVSAAYQVTNTNWTIAGRADFNHDGQTDLLWQNPLTGQVAIWLMSGTTLKQELLLPQVVSGQWTIVGTGDFNHDGDIDIVWRDYQSGSNGIWFMDNTTLLSAVALAPQTDVAWKIVGVADINQDNQLDLIWRHDQLGSNGIWLMKNASEILGFGGIAPVTDTAWKIVGIADVDGDTHADLFWRNEQSGANGIWLMNGNQMRSVASLLTVSDPNWKLDEIGDFNGDGKFDLVWRNYATGITAAWLMNGNNLLQTTVIQNGNSNNDVLLGDHGKVYSALPLWQNVFAIDTGAGQGGAGDIMFGNQGDDLMLGQQGGDAMFGETGEDDMLGGHNVAGGDDGSDLMDGGAQADVMLGDNGVILRRPLGYQLWQRYPAPFANVIRDVTRYDDRDWIGGNDTMFGGTEDDVMHGQRGDDWMYGNAGDDEMYGELGNDNMSGGAGVDTMLGDVGIITHAYNPDGTPRLNQHGSWHRDVILTDVGEITASVSAATPSVEMFQTADVLLATGTTNPDGSQRTDLQVISLFNDGYDAMSGDDGDDAMFGQRGNDTMHGGAGNDYMQGNAGDDQVHGDDGNDFVIGDDSNNLAAFNTEIPNVTRGLHLITRSAGVNINLGLDGVVVMPAVNLTPKMTYGLLPTLTLAPQQSRDNSPVPVIGNLQAGDGSVLQPLVAIVPNLVNHLDQLSGQDTVNGGAGADLVVGDDFSNVMPLRTGNPGIDPVIDQLTRQLYQLIYDVHDLELASMNAAPQSLTVMIGNDVVDGGDDNDSVFGDNHLFYGPFVRQMPNSTGDLWSLLTGLQSAIATVSYGVNQLIPASSLWPKPFSLSLGNDVVRGGAGEDFLYADDSMTIAPILNTLNYQRGSFWSYNLAGANRPARTNFRDYDLQLGNDDMSGGGGHDLMVGGYSTIINPLVTVPVAPTDINLQRSLELLISDINTFVRDLHTDNHGILYDTRNQSHTLIAQNDVMRGDSGNDLLVGDNTTLTAPFLNGQINTSIPLSRDYLDYSEEEHNFMHGLQHQYDLAYRRANLGFTRMAEDGLFGGDDNDILLGLRAIDIMFGDWGNDFLAGGDDADQITEAGSGNIIRNTNPSPADRRDIINPAAQLMLTNLLSPVMQQYIQQILQSQNNLALEGQFYANFPG